MELNMAELNSISPLPASDIGAFAAAAVAHVAAVAVVHGADRRKCRSLADDQTPTPGPHINA